MVAKKVLENPTEFRKATEVWDSHSLVPFKEQIAKKEPKFAVMLTKQDVSQFNKAPEAKTEKSPQFEFCSKGEHFTANIPGEGPLASLFGYNKKMKKRTRVKAFTRRERPNGCFYFLAKGRYYEWLDAEPSRAAKDLMGIELCRCK